MLKGDAARLRCAAMRSHAFEPFTPIYRTDKFREAIGLKCIYCDTERYDTLNIYGEVMTRRYKYPEKYKQLRFKNTAEARVSFYSGLAVDEDHG